MEENEIAISLDVESIQENITRKMYKGTIAIIKSVFVRFIEIIASLVRNNCFNTINCCSIFPKSKK